MELARSLLLSTIVVRGSASLWLLITMMVLMGAGGPANAEETAAKPPALTAAEFLGKVEKSNPGLELLEGDMDLESAAATAAGLWSNPSLAYDREEIFAGSRGYPENILKLELPLEISGRRGLRVDAAELGVSAARQTADRGKKALLLDALEVYLRAAAARLNLDVLQAERAALERLVEAVKSRTAAGDASGYDLDRLAIEAEAQGDLIAEAERSLLVYRRALGRLAGDPSARFDAGDTLALPTYQGGTAGDSVLSSHPAYRAAALRVQQAETELRAAGRGWVPTLSASGGAKSALIDTDTRWGYVAGLTLSLPFLDYGQADAERARARLRTARAEQRLIEYQVLTQAGTGDEILVRSVEQARKFEETQLPRLDRLIRRAETSYQEGERPVFELLDAYRTARGVRLRAIELRLQARLAEVDLWRARGVAPGGSP
jgi:cobalt-zinc-cadmium efflux system outer membrane protein